MIEKWFTTDLTSLTGVAVSGLFVYAAIILYCRIAGLRSFSKMSAPDFAMTVAVGSLFAATISSPSPTLLLGLFALGWLFAGQWAIAFFREKNQGFAAAVDNDPILLMRGSHILEENLRTANVTKSDLMSKLREANVHNFDQITAVIFESTGDVTVLHFDEDAPRLDSEILTGVVGWDETCS